MACDVCELSPSMTQTKEQPTFEEALAELETLVSAMEEGATPLAELVANFEKGTKLLAVCQSRLNDAEMKIQKLKETATGLKLTAVESDEE